jgi:hypothetical protein
MTEVGRDDNTAWRDVVLYQGPEKDINFAELSEAAVIFALSVSTRQDSAPNNQLSIVNNQSPLGDTLRRTVVANWSRPGKSQMSLTVPIKPLPSAQQRSAASARLGSTNPWKTSAPSTP